MVYLKYPKYQINSKMSLKENVLTHEQLKTQEPDFKTRNFDKLGTNHRNSLPEIPIAKT